MVLHPESLVLLHLSTGDAFVMQQQEIQFVSHLLVLLISWHSWGHVTVDIICEPALSPCVIGDFPPESSQFICKEDLS